MSYYSVPRRKGAEIQKGKNTWRRGSRGESAGRRFRQPRCGHAEDPTGAFFKLRYHNRLLFAVQFSILLQSRGAGNGPHVGRTLYLKLARLQFRRLRIICNNELYVGGRTHDQLGIAIRGSCQLSYDRRYRLSVTRYYYHYAAQAP